MPGPWKERKAKPRVATLSTAPWKSGQSGQIPTFPPPLLPFSYSQLKDEKKGSRPLRGLPKPHSFQDHPVLEWIPVSGSFSDWNMLGWKSTPTQDCRLFE